MSTVFYAAILVLQALPTFASFKSRARQMDGLSLWITIAFLGIQPIGVLLDSLQLGGAAYFVSDRIPQYVYLMATGLVMLYLLAAIVEDRGTLLPTRNVRDLASPLLLALAIRLGWLIPMETRHIVDFSVLYPAFGIQYVVLSSIPLFLAVLVLALWKTRAAYWLGALMGAVHVILTALLVILHVNQGLGPVLVIGSSLAICYCSIRALRAEKDIKHGYTHVKPAIQGHDAAV